MDNERTFIGRSALVVLITGLLGAMVIGTFTSTLAGLHFALVAEGLAVILGIIGWSTLSGRIGAIGAGILVVVLGAMHVFEQMDLYKARSAPSRSKGMEEMERRRESP